jgi:hypothetical protein
MDGFAKKQEEVMWHNKINNDTRNKMKKFLFPFSRKKAPIQLSLKLMGLISSKCSVWFIT